MESLLTKDLIGSLNKFQKRSENSPLILWRHNSQRKKLLWSLSKFCILAKWNICQSFLMLGKKSGRLKSQEFSRHKYFVIIQNKKLVKYKDTIFRHFESQEGKEIIESMFWQVFLNNFTEWSNKSSMTAVLHKQVAKNYNRLFVLMEKDTRDFVMDCFTVLVGIQVYKLFTGIFKQDAKSFNSRFLVDCIHFVV